MDKKNLFSQIPDSSDEILDCLVKTEKLKIERIISSGQSTPAGEWYNQENNEWVILLEGNARLRFENEPDLVEMNPGDYLMIPAHVRHRVEWTDPGARTVWLAVYYKQ